jgi:tetratricopeptide (TPR) repeat protein
MSFMARVDLIWQAQALWFHEHPYRLEGDWQAARDINNQGYEAGTFDPFFLATRVMLEYQVGEFNEGEIYIKRILEAMRAAPPGPSPEYAYSALVTAYAARITGVSDRLEVALSAGMTVVSSPAAVPLIASLARIGLSLIAVVRGDEAAAEENYVFFQAQRGTMYFDFSVDRLLGLLAQTMGKLEDAMSHFEDAQDFCRKAGYRPELAWTCCDFADTLRERDADGDRSKAISLLDESLAISSELGMRPLMERVLSRREILRA